MLTPFWVLGLGVTLLHLGALSGGTYFLDVYLTEVHPHWAEVGRALQDGRLPLWTSDLMAGYPLAANPQIGVFYPPHLLLAWLLDAHVMLTLSVWLHGLVAAFGAYGLARQAGATSVGATVAGLCWAGAPFVVFYHQAIHGTVALALLPVILHVTWRAVERRSPRLFALGALLLALQMYAGHLQFVLYTLIASAVIGVFGPAHPSWRARAAAFGACVAQGAVAVLLYGPQLFLAYELWSHSLRSGLGADEILASIGVEALGADDLVELVMPRFFGGPSYRDFWYPEFLDAGVLICAMVGLRSGRVFGGLALGVVVYLALVQTPGIGRMLVSLPVLGAFRAPARTLCLLLLALCVLAGLGVDTLRRGERLRAVRLACVAAAALGAVAVAGVFAGIAPRDAGMDAGLVANLRRLDGLELVLSAAALALATALVGRTRLGAAALVFAVAAPVLWVGSRYNPTLHTLEPSPVLDDLRRAGAGRVLGVSAGDPSYMTSVPGPEGWPYRRRSTVNGRAVGPERAGWTLVANVGLGAGVANLHGQTSLPLSRFVTRMFGDTRALGYPFQRHPDYDPGLLAHAGVTHVVTAEDGQMPVVPRPPFAFGEEGIEVHALAERRARARFYPLALVQDVQGPDDALARVQRTGPRPDVPLVVEGLAAAPTATTGEPLPVRLAAGPGRLLAEVTAPEAGVLFINEAWYPGWRATLDGAQAPVHPADGAFLAVPVPAGTHRVELTFTAPGLWWGLIPLGLGLLLLAVAALKPDALTPRQASLDS